MPGLGTSFGRGGATTAQTDLARADAILIMGSSMAENHPVGFQWVMEARERGATLIHVDPRFTRTSAMADIWVPLRPGSDIIFLGALINYVLTNNRWFDEYVRHYTNATFLLRQDFKDTEDLGGVFSGWDEEKRQYDPTSWLYEESPEKETRGATGTAPTAGGHGQRGGEASKSNIFIKDESMQDPRCVFQVLKRHFARYTPEMVEEYCGVAQDVFLKAAEAFTNASGPEKTAAICYAVGWTQHSKGPQIIRSAAILQMLLGNIGRPGGGILALRGHASIQGSTDIPTLYDILPGYLPMPFFDVGTYTWDKYLEKHTAQTGIWASYESYIVSLLRAYYGDNAKKENDWGFDWLPRVTGDHSQLGYWLQMEDGKMDGLFVIGQNPVVGAPNGRLQRIALSKLKWLVVRDMVETETASFWYDSPEVRRGELDPKSIATEVFLMPAAGQAEKSGMFTNTQRLLQFHNKAVDPPGDARSDTWFIYHLGRLLKDKAARNRSARNEPMNALQWNYPTEGPTAEPKIDEIDWEINGFTWTDRKLIKSYKELKSDGSTACGCWIYAGFHPEPTLNKANQREPKDYLGHGWGFAWPNDSRVIYNRASAAPDGKPWSEKKKLVWWDEQKKTWTGLDRPDFDLRKSPDHPGDLRNGKGVDALPGDAPFILHSDGVAWLFVNSGLKDGPLPAHYEPLESIISNPLYPDHGTNPAAQTKQRPDNPYAKQPNDPRFPYVLSTYRLTEHHTAGGMSRTLPHLAELQPELFCEISPELAGELGIINGEWVTITTPRGIVSAHALVTSRVRPVTIGGRKIHTVGIPYHWGWKGMAQGDVANDLLAISEEPNVRIMETKALVCNLTRGHRFPDGAGALEQFQREIQRVA
ncbi:MAG TPA: molybdopterin-dependent oxidoreductase [Terriglobales bacterium]|nr:molybdopterin-dependent oxidoreductase [Terriglobales bacterium]